MRRNTRTSCCRVSGHPSAPAVPCVVHMPALLPVPSQVSPTNQMGTSQSPQISAGEQGHAAPQLPPLWPAMCQGPGAPVFGEKPSLGCLPPPTSQVPLGPLSLLPEQMWAPSGRWPGPAWTLSLDTSSCSTHVARTFSPLSGIFSFPTCNLLSGSRATFVCATGREKRS